MFDVTFQIEGGAPVVVPANRGDTLLEIARGANVAIDAPCSGNGACGKCRVQLLEGTLDSQQTTHISDADYAAGWRLSCCSHITGDVTVLVPDIASAYQRRMKTADLSSGEEIAIFEALLQQIRGAGVALANNARVLPVTLEQPTLDDTMPDNERLERALCRLTGCKQCVITYDALRGLAQVLRENQFHVQAVADCGGECCTVYALLPPEPAAHACAVAIDIGTTTVSAVLADCETGRLLAKASSGNGQIRYGADVINRIVEQAKPGGRQRLQDAIIKETLTPLLQALCRDAAVPPACVTRLCVAGNTTMNHLLLAVDAEPVRMEPYIPSFFRFDGLRAGDLALPVHPDAPVWLAPNIGSYVGGDITAGSFASLIWNRPEYALFIDLGTNGELVFGNEDFLMSCACSAGPAFEGGDISCGMRATDGAVEAVQLEKETLEPKLRIVGPAGQRPVGICGSGIIDVIAELYRISAIRPEGQFRPGGPPHRSGYPRDGALYPGLCRRIGDGAGDRHHRGGHRLISSGPRVRFISAIDTMLSALDFDAGDDRPGLCRGRHRQRHQYGKRRAHRHVSGCTPGEIPVYRQFLPGRGLCHGALGGCPGQGRRDRIRI